MKIGEKIQALRKSSGMSQENLAQYLNINRNCLSRIETGKVDPSITLVKEISLLFNVNLESLAGMPNKQTNAEEKIKKITEDCSCLNDYDLDIIIRMTSLMREEFLNKGGNIIDK